MIKKPGLPDGGYIPLERVADINPEEGPRQISRENGWRRVIVSINIKDIDTGTYVDNLQSKIEEDVNVPIG